MSENTSTILTVVKLSFFVAFAVIALLVIREPAPERPGGHSNAGATKSAHAAMVQPAEGDVVIARVDGRPVYRSDFMVVYQSLSPQAKQYGMATIYPVLLERLVDEKLLMDVAVKAVPADDPALVKQVRLATERAMTEIYFTQTIDAAVTDEKIRARYDKSVAEFSGVEEVSARHILVETEEKAKEVLAIVQGGADFAETAKEHSIGPSSANGGDLGFFTRDQMLAPFADAAFAMPTGEISPEPVKTEYGWHIIKVDDRRQTEAPSFEEKRDEVASELTREVATALLDGLRGKAEIEKFDMEGNPLPANPEAPAGAAQGQEAPPAQQ